MGRELFPLTRRSPQLNNTNTFSAQFKHQPVTAATRSPFRNSYYSARTGSRSNKPLCQIWREIKTLKNLSFFFFIKPLPLRSGSVSLERWVISFCRVVQARVQFLLGRVFIDERLLRTNWIFKLLGLTFWSEDILFFRKRCSFCAIHTVMYNNFKPINNSICRNAIYWLYEIDSIPQIDLIFPEEIYSALSNHWATLETKYISLERILVSCGKAERIKLIQLFCLSSHKHV